jgi:putative flippase GtrA
MFLQIAINRASVIKVAKFGIAGLIGLVIDFSITYILKEHFLFNKYVSNSVGFVVAATCNFILNKWWTFKSSNKFHKEYIIFLSIAVAGLLINSTILYLFHAQLQLNFYLAKLIAIIIVFVWNFIMNSRFNFGNNSSK